ncbi:MAG: SMI1/KNR4 family protein, partial [Lachnospiraceae bacterium]|nr:SMI1/KNR4 family protein [Lachnospiraceae bacterium]
MNREEFAKLTQEVKRSRPKIFGLDADNIPTVADIKSVEKYFGVVFPEKYKEFVLQYGGGYFAFTVVYSFD